MKLRIYPPTPVSVEVPPISYIDNGTPTSVSDEKALPSLMKFIKNGEVVTVNHNSDPLQMKAIPVDVMGATISLDSVTIDTDGLATDAKQDTIISNLGTVIADIGLLAKEATLGLVKSALDALSAKLPASLGAKTKALSLSITPATDSGLATEVKQDSTITKLTELDNAVDAMSVKLPASLGAKTKALSLSVTPSTDAGLPTGLVSVPYTGVDMTYTDGKIATVIYKQGATTVATLTLTYTDGNLTGVVKS